MNSIIGKLAFASTLSLLVAGGAGCTVETDTPGDVSEARQESQLLTTYKLNRQLKSHNLKVSVDEGVATLTGKVNEDIDRELAHQLALGVNGVKDVDNRIEVDKDLEPEKPAGERSYGEVVEDASITAAVKSKLLWSKHAQGLSANVEVLSGNVTLVGGANSQEAKEMAGLLATNTHGVNAVDNRLEVDGEAGNTMLDSAKDETEELGQRISDTWITTKVKSTFMYSSNVDGSDISVSTKDGVVALSGALASEAEHALATELAKNVRGVRSVNTRGLTLS